MSQTKLSPGRVEPVTAEDVAAPDTAELAALGGSVPAQRPTAQVSGTIRGMSGFALPPSYLKIAYGVGGLSDKNFTNGALVLDDTISIAGMKEPITIIPLGACEFLKTWMSGAEYAAGIKASEYASREEAVAAGETVEWTNGQGPSVAPAMRLLFLIRRPPGCEAEQFILRLDGEFYAPASFTADKGLYQDIAPFFHRTSFFEAGLRGVPQSEGRIDKWFCTLNTYSKENKKSGYKVVHMCANYLFKDGKKVEVPAQVMEDMNRLGLRQATTGGAPAEDEAPPVAADI